jgi:hypothetical protein
LFDSMAAAGLSATLRRWPQPRDRSNGRPALADVITDWDQEAIDIMAPRKATGGLERCGDLVIEISLKLSQAR